jgi:ABC-type nitrate/sulfonate/bicarbonate transport system substrate-binding protein
MIKAVWVHFQKAPACLASKKERGIDSPEKIKGKKVGINTDEVIMIKTVLATMGLSYKDITPVETKSDIQALAEDQIDVCAGYMNNEPLTMKEKGYEMNVIPLFKYGYDFYAGVVFTTDQFIREQPVLIQKFADASLRGWKEVFKDPAGAAKLIVEKYYPQGSLSQQTESLKIFNYLATIGIGKSLVGYMQKEFWQKGIDILYEFKQIDRKIPPSDVFTLEFLKK